MEELNYIIEEEFEEKDAQCLIGALIQIEGVEKVEINTEEKEKENSKKTSRVVHLKITAKKNADKESISKSVKKICTNFTFIRKTSLIIGDKDGSLYVVKDDNLSEKNMKLFDLILKTGIYKKDLMKSWYRKHVLSDSELEENDSVLRRNDMMLCNHMAKNINIDDEKTFELCEYLAQNGLVIMIREENLENGEDVYNIRLYVPKMYEDFNQTILIDQICNRLQLNGSNKYREIYMHNHTLTIYVDNTLIMDHQKIKSVENVQKTIQFNSPYIYNMKEDTLVVSKDDKIYWLNNNSDEDPIKYGYRIYRLSKNHHYLVFGSPQDPFLPKTNQKALYVPIDVLDSSEQMRSLEIILKEYERIRKSDMSLPDDFSLSIYVDGVFLKRLSNDSYKWNGEDDYSFDRIMKDITDRINEKDKKTR